MLLYLYSVAFGIFLTNYVRIPAPFLFGVPLIILYKEKMSTFLYAREVLLLIAAILSYYGYAQGDIKNAIANCLTILFCAIYFNYFVGYNYVKYYRSILIFFSLLLLSALIMVFNHFYAGPAIAWRTLLMGEAIQQSPSGISLTIFTFGYQLAALVSFLTVYTIVFKKSLLFKFVVLLACLVFVYLGMNRSVLITFILSNVLFLLIYYKYKAVLIIATSLIMVGFLYSYSLKTGIEANNNIVSKNTDSDARFSRTGLIAENLEIYADYPYGLIFYGKSWDDVVYRNQIFGTGITSHNAYLMFFTYMGPFLGLGFLFLIYSKIFGIIGRAIRNIRIKEYGLLVCLCFSFLGVSMNALSHNGWLIGGDGPTFFLYFSLLHFNHMLDAKVSTV